LQTLSDCRIKTEDLLELTRGDRRLALETVVGVLEGTSVRDVLKSHVAAFMNAAVRSISTSVHYLA
jgi:hypothetical protein